MMHTKQHKQRVCKQSNSVILIGDERSLLKRQGKESTNVTVVACPRVNRRFWSTAVLNC